MKIAIIGTHGTGKTTLAYMLAAYAQEKGFSAKVVGEIARSNPFPLNENFDTDGAHWIISTQIKRELDAKREKTQCVICDRSTIDPIGYLRALNKPQTSYEGLRIFAEEWLKTYDHIVFVTPSGEAPQFDGVRSMDPDFKLEVHNQIASLVDLKKQNLIVFSSKHVFEKDISELTNKLF